MKTKHSKFAKVLAIMLCMLMTVTVLPLTAFAKYTYEYYSANNTKYFYQVCIYYDSDSNSDATDWLKNNGWTPVGGNFNAGDGNDSKYIHLGVKYTTDPTVAIRGFQVRDGDRPSSYSAAGTYTGQTVTWYCVGSGAITQTPAAGDGVVDLNKGGGGNDLTLYVTVDPKAGPPVTEYTQTQNGTASTAQSALTNNGWTVAWDQNGNWQDCNEGSGGDYLYEGYKSSATAVDTTALRSAISGAATYTGRSTWYTSASLSVLSTAVANAQTCVNAFDSRAGVAAYTQTDINNLYNAIINAENNLCTTITLNATENGGTSGSTTVSVKVGTGSSGALNFGSYKGTKSGYIFKGWSKSSTTATTTGLLNSSTTVGINETYYAIYSKDYSFNYIYIDPSTNTKAVDTQTKTIWNNASAPTFTAQKNRNNVTIDGTTFKLAGYSSTATAAAPEYSSGMIKAAVGTVYAIYSADITLTYDAGKGSPTPAAETKTIYLTCDANGNIINPGATFTVTSAEPSYAGGPFNGWSTTPGSETAQYKAGDTLTSAKNVNLYAVFGLYKYTVTFNNAEGTVINTQTVGYGNDATAPDAPEKASDDEYQYIFAGWDKAFTNITADTVLNPTYTQKAHDWTITHVTLPDCTTTGTDLYTCKDCGYKKIVTVEALGHSLSTEKGYDPTCTTAGKTDKITCTRCGEVMQEQAEIAALGHDWQLTETVVASCSSNGYDLYTCSRCSLTEKRNVTDPDYNNHTEVEIPAVPATCTTNGSTAGTECSVCGAVIVSPKTVIAEGHKWADATCTAPRTCKGCGLTEGKALGHNYEISEAKAATCTEDGYTEGKRCTRCDDIPKGSEVTVIPATGHDWEETSREAATCAKEGTISYRCSVCEETKTESIEKLPHTEEAIADVEATCAKQGSKGGTKCSVCGAIIVEPEIISKPDHTWVKRTDTVAPTCKAEGRTAIWDCSVCGATKGGTTIEKVSCTYGSWTTVKAATCTEEGLKVRSCKYCGANPEEKVLPAVGHIEITSKEVAATCTTAGKTAGTKCAICGIQLTGGEVIKATGHSYLTYKTVEATCTEDGYVLEKCEYCGDIREVSRIDAFGHTEVEIPAVEATCVKLGATAGKKCSVCGTITVKPEVVNKTAHTKVEYGAVPATCKTTGMKAGVKCSVCGRIYSEPSEIPALEHERDLGTITVTPTCVTEGEITYKCINCGEILAVESLGYGSHTLPAEYKIEGGTLKFTCPVCSQEVSANPSEYGLPDEGCENCGLHHTDDSSFFGYNGFYCKLVGFFRSIIKWLQNIGK